MAKKEDLMTGFGNRMRKDPPVRKSLGDRLADEPEGEHPESAPEPVRTAPGNRTASARIGRKYNYTTLYVEPAVYEQLREIARRHRLNYNEIVNAAFRKYVELYEARHGSLQTPRESNISADSLV